MFKLEVKDATVAIKQIICLHQRSLRKGDCHNNHYSLAKEVDARFSPEHILHFLNGNVVLSVQDRDSHHMEP